MVVSLTNAVNFRPIFQLATTRAGSGVTVTPGPDRLPSELGGRLVEAAFR